MSTDVKKVEIKMRTPWQVSVGIVMLVASFVPIWAIDLGDAPNESQIRFWTTVVVAIALWAIAKKIMIFRWLLLILLGTGALVSIWSFYSASLIETESALITLLQMIGLGLLFTPKANLWFKTRSPH